MDTLASGARLLPLLLLAAGVACDTPTADDGGTDAGVDGGNDPVDGGGGGPYRLQYDYGNQISGSSLKLDEQFILHRTERTCCPPAELDASVPELSPAEALQLHAAMRSCEGSPAEPVPSDGGALGGSYGIFTLLVPADGGATVLRLETTDQAGGYHLHRNTCAALPQLLGFVNGIVDVDMPLQD